MSGAHLHLLVNHAPVFGALFALALLACSFFYSPDALRRVALVVLVGTALGSVASDLTGDPAEHAIEGLPGVKREVIHAHEDMAGKSYIVAGLVGLLALGALVKTRGAPVSNGLAGGALIASLVVSGMMGYTALLGGRVRHTEIRPDATAAEASAIEAPRARGPRPPVAP